MRSPVCVLSVLVKSANGIRKRSPTLSKNIQRYTSLSKTMSRVFNIPNFDRIWNALKVYTQDERALSEIPMCFVTDRKLEESESAGMKLDNGYTKYMFF